MRINKTKTLIAAMALMLLLWISGSVGAYPPADEPTGRSGVGVASVVSPLLQYQGRLTDPITGEPVADGNYTMTFRLYDAASGGSPLWTETKDVSVQGGLFSTVLGDTTALDQTLFNGQALWLGVKVMADAEATPRQQVLPAAYALSLVPGAQVTGESDDLPALRLNHTGDGNALRGIISSPNPDRTAIIGVNNGPGWGIAGVANSDGAAGVAGFNSGAGPGVRGESVGGAGGYFTSTNSYGVYGYSGNSNGVRGEAVGSFAAVSGVNLGDGPGGYFSSSSGPALYADGSAEVTGDLTVGGSLTGGSHDHDDLYYAKGESDGRFVNVEGPEGISGDSPDPILGVVQTGSGEALYVQGLTILDGDLTVNGSLTGANGTTLPIAYGVVLLNGGLASGSPNVSSTWNSSDSWYEITISGHSYFWSDYVTVVTLLYPCNYAYTVRTSSVGGDLIVIVYDGTGSEAQCDFQFATHKP